MNELLPALLLILPIALVLTLLIRGSVRLDGGAEEIAAAAPTPQRTSLISVLASLALGATFEISVMTFFWSWDASPLPLLTLLSGATIAALVVRAFIERSGRVVSLLTAALLVPFFGATRMGFVDRITGEGMQSTEVCMGIVDGYTSAVPCSPALSLLGLDPAALFDRSIAFFILYVAIALYIARSKTAGLVVRTVSAVGLLASALLAYQVSSNYYGFYLLAFGGYFLLVGTGAMVAIWAFAALRSTEATGPNT
jgi:hypothetical protein